MTQMCPEPLPAFDRMKPPLDPVNKEAARARGWCWNAARNCYIDTNDRAVADFLGQRMKPEE